VTKALDVARRDGLLARLSPWLLYHKQEPYWASSPGVMTDSFVEGHYANSLHRKDRTKIAQAGPSLVGRRLNLDLLDGQDYGGGTKPQKTDYINAHGDTYQQDAARMQAKTGYADKVYGRVTQARAGRVWLQYWFFYYFNDKSLAGIGLHEGDWEMIQIGLDSAGNPEVATYAQHAYAEKRDDWSEVKKEDDRDDGAPLVYVALGSHAAYFEPGEHRMEPVPLLDHARGNGRKVRPELIEMSDELRWLAWPGRWGRMGDSNGPDGPSFHDRQWKQPDVFHEKAKKRRTQIGPIFFAVPEEARVPPPAVSAVRDGDRVTVAYDFRAARGSPESPARVLLSVEPRGKAEQPITASFVVARERARVRHPARLGRGRYLLHATAFTPQDAASETVTVDVEEARPQARRRAGAKRA
jgi:hypothetical protein